MFEITSNYERSPNLLSYLNTHILDVHRRRRSGRREHSRDKWCVLTPCCDIITSVTATRARRSVSVLLGAMMKASFPLIEPLQSARCVEQKHSRGLAEVSRQLRGVFKRLITATCSENRRLAQHGPRKKTKITVSVSALPPPQLCVPATYVRHEDR